MAKFAFSDIEDTFMWVSAADYGMNGAVLCKDTGRILYRSESTGVDEIEDEADLDWSHCVQVPHEYDLDLGRNLVFEFVEDRLPDDYEQVRRIFRRPGAYSRYRTLLAARGLLQAWYDFQNDQENRAIRQWCEFNQIDCFP